MTVYYSRYGTVESKDFPTFAQAVRFVDVQEDAGAIFCLGIYDEETRTMHVKQDEIFYSDWTEEQALKEMMPDYKKRGIEPVAVRFY